jgi:hypothetical protein
LNTRNKRGVSYGEAAGEGEGDDVDEKGLGAGKEVGEATAGIQLLCRMLTCLSACASAPLIRRIRKLALRSACLPAYSAFPIPAFDLPCLLVLARPRSCGPLW